MTCRTENVTPFGESLGFRYEGGHRNKSGTTLCLHVPGTWTKCPDTNSLSCQNVKMLLTENT